MLVNICYILRRGKDRATASLVIKEKFLSQTTEKRRFPRVSLSSPLHCQLRGTGLFKDAVCNDISVGGVSFLNEGYIPPSTQVGIEIGIFSRIIKAIGKIAWSMPLPHSNRYRIGIEFLELDQPDKNFLSDYIDMRLDKL